MTLLIRAARPEDAATLAALAAAVGREPGGWLLNTDGWRSVAEERRYLRALRRHPDAAVFVAEDDGAIVGRLSIARDPHQASRHVADLGLMVADGHRRRGIGRALLEQAVAWAREAGVRKLELHVFPWNEPAIQLYEQFGFEREGLPQGPLPPRRRVRRRDSDGVLPAGAARARAAGPRRRPGARPACPRAQAPCVVSRCNARPGSSRPLRRPDGCCTAFQSSIVTPIETTATSAPVTVGVRMLGATRSKSGRDGNRERGEVRAAAR